MNSPYTPTVFKNTFVHIQPDMQAVMMSKAHARPSMFYINPLLLEIKLYEQMLHTNDGITHKGQEKNGFLCTQ